MRTLLLYDSSFGNTEKIAKAIGSSFKNIDGFIDIRCKDALSISLVEFDLLLIGSPTRAFSATECLTNIIKSLRKNELKGKKVATFDTRIALETIDNKILLKFVKLGGYASKPVAKILRKKGAELIIEPEGFLVEDTEGPLVKGEIDRAKNWGKEILQRAEESGLYTP